MAISCIRPSRYKIKTIIDKIDNDKICLPDFQREFVWKPDQMAKLVESIIRKYPIGTLLFLNTRVNHWFGKRSFKGTDEELIDPDYFVIDGQQRLNTLYWLLKIPSNYEPREPIEYNGKNYKIFYRVQQNLENLPTEVIRPQFIIVERIEKDEMFNYKAQGKQRIIPIEYILSDRYTNRWIKDALNHVSRKEQNRCKRNIQQVKRIINEYYCIIQCIDSKLKPQDHYNIFQLLNTAGTELTIFDLMVAKLNQIHINLRKLWNDCQNNYPEIKSFDIDPIYILKIISIIRDTQNESEKKPSCAYQDLMKLDKHYILSGGNRDFENDWVHACTYLQKSIQYIKYFFGIQSKKYIPYSPMIITLASILWWFEKYKGGYNQKYKSTFHIKIKNWYWGSILNQEYRASTDNKISIHYDALRKWVKPNCAQRTPNDIAFYCNKTNLTGIIDQIDSTADARYKAIICFPLRTDNGAKDIFSHEFLFDEKLHDHHIFPIAFIKSIGIKQHDDINHLANRMLITDKTNLEISKQGPYDYLKTVRSDILKKHYLFKNLVTTKMSFNDFIIERKRIIVRDLLNYLNG